MRILGGILIIFGFLISLSIIGAVVGIPMILIGLVLVALGGRRKTIISNVVQVSNIVPDRLHSNEPLPPSFAPNLESSHRIAPEPAVLLPTRNESVSDRQRFAHSVDAPKPAPVHENNASEAMEFDRAKWAALLKYDDDLRAVADKLGPFGKKWVDEFAADYLAMNDKAYLPVIVQKLIKRIKSERSPNL